MFVVISDADLLWLFVAILGLQCLWHMIARSVAERLHRRERVELLNELQTARQQLQLEISSRSRLQGELYAGNRNEGGESAWATEAEEWRNLIREFARQQMHLPIVPTHELTEES